MAWSAPRSGLNVADPAEVTDYHLLSVIVPVFNERNTLPEILRRMRRVDEIHTRFDAPTKGGSVVVDACVQHCHGNALASVA